MSFLAYNKSLYCVNVKYYTFYMRSAFNTLQSHLLFKKRVYEFQLESDMAL